MAVGFLSISCLHWRLALIKLGGGGGGKQTNVPGMRGSHTTLGFASLNFSKLQPCCLEISQQESPG